MEHRDDVLKACQKRLGYTFRKPALLWEALQPAARRGHKRHDNKNLAYVGDAVLSLALRVQAIESGISRKNASFVLEKLESNQYLTNIGIAAGIHAFINTKKEHVRFWGMHGKSIADAMEAILGAVYRDGDMNQVLKVMTKLGLGLQASLGALRGPTATATAEERYADRIKRAHASGHTILGNVEGFIKTVAESSKTLNCFRRPDQLSDTESSSTTAPPAPDFPAISGTAGTGNQLPAKSGSHNDLGTQLSEGGLKLQHPLPLQPTLASYAKASQSATTIEKDAGQDSKPGRISPHFDVSKVDGVKPWLGTDSRGLIGTARKIERPATITSYPAERQTAAASATPQLSNHQFGRSSFDLSRPASPWTATIDHGQPATAADIDLNFESCLPIASKAAEDHNKQERQILETLRSKMSYFKSRYGRSKDAKVDDQEIADRDWLRKIRSGRVDKGAEQTIVFGRTSALRATSQAGRF